MATKLSLFPTLLFLLLSIPARFSDFADGHGISAARSSSSLQDSHEIFAYRLPQKFNHGPRNPRNGLRRARFAAEMPAAHQPRNSSGNQSSAGPKAAPASSSHGNVGEQKTKGKEEKKKNSARKWLVGVGLGSITGAIFAVACSFLYRTIRFLYRTIRDYVRRHKPGKPMIFRRRIMDAETLKFLGRADATESLELLGRGGSGEVYKATLKSGEVVAVKRVASVACSVNGGGIDPALEKSFDLTKNTAQIMAELNTLAQIRHRNIVGLLAYIPQPTAHLLIYEFMANGSLHDILMKVAKKELDLPWSKRLAIAIDIATGLEYLHFECFQRIVHCDLKPGNILLDGDMTAHIGDFGLAKIVPDQYTHITGSKVAGTVGYMAPEHYQKMRHTPQGDIYAFGVVLIVLLTGKEPTDSLFSNVVTHMGDWLANVLAAGSENVVSILDSPLRGHGCEAEMILALKVASFCLHEDPRARPDAKIVLKMLKQIKVNAPESLRGIDTLLS